MPMQREQHDTFFHSVHLEKDLCKGCINCIKRCPTQAIRVRNGKANITKEFCIDCGECIRICSHHAKKAVFDPFDIPGRFEYTVALPAPSLFGQFNNLDDPAIVLQGLLDIGFDDVYEVSAAAELVSELTRNKIAEGNCPLPIISSACPSVVRLIRVRFPSLLELMPPLNPPIDVAAAAAARIAVEKSGLPREKIGIIFISPCPAKVTAVYSPLGMEKSEVDAVFAISDVYPRLLQVMKHDANSAAASKSGKIGIGWGGSGGEADGLLNDNYLAADGIENVIRVLEDLEDGKLQEGLEFIELNACAGGCVGGVLTVENPFIAKTKLKRLKKYMPVALNHLDGVVPDGAYQDFPIKYEPVYRLGEGIEENIALMAKAEELMSRLPDLDCGSCGAPTCEAFAKDVVCGIAKEKECIHLLRDYLHKLSNEIGD